MTNFIQPYNPEWKTGFQHLKHVLETALNGLDTDIQHVGSTAVPGLFAKPILDIDIIISNKSLFGELASRLEKIGYINKGEQGIPGRFAFRQRSPATIPETGMPHHLYVCFSDSLALKNHLVFRDALLNDKELAASYSALKKALIEERGMTREEYTKQKTAFIISALTALGLELHELNDIKGANS